MAKTLNRCAAEVNLCLQRGDTAPFGFNIQNTDGTPATITGFTYKFTVSTTPVPDGGTPPPEFTLAGSVSGSTVTISPAVGDVDRVGVFFFDLEETDGAGKIQTVAKGKVEWRQDISK